MSRIEIPRSGAKGNFGYEGVVPRGDHGGGIAVHERLVRDTQIPDNLVTTTEENEADGIRVNIY